MIFPKQLYEVLRERIVKMDWALLGLGWIASIVALVCCILVIVKMFQNEQTGLGIATIVGLFVCGLGHILSLRSFSDGRTRIFGSFNR
jgi:hypothetical protein